MPMDDELAQSTGAESPGSETPGDSGTPSPTHNCECSRAQRIHTCPEMPGQVRKIGNKAKCVISLLRAAAQLSELSCDLASRTSCARQLKPLGKRVDRERRPHLPTATALKNLKEPGSPSVAPTVRNLKIIRAADSAITPRQTSTIHCQRRTAPPDHVRHRTCESPRPRRGRAPTDPLPQGIKDGVRGCQAPDPFSTTIISSNLVSPILKLL